MTGQDQHALQDLNASTESTITFMASGSPDTDRERELLVSICQESIEEWKQATKSTSGTNTTKKKTKTTQKAYRTKRRGDVTIEMMNALGPEEQLDVLLEHKELTGDVEPKDIIATDDEGDENMEHQSQQRNTHSRKTLRERTRPPNALQRICTKCQKKDMIENMWECIICKAYTCIEHTCTSDTKPMCPTCNANPEIARRGRTQRSLTPGTSSTNPTTHRTIMKRSTTAESSHHREVSQPKSPRLTSDTPATVKDRPITYGPEQSYAESLQRENQKLQEHNKTISSRLGASDRMIQQQHDALKYAQQVSADQSQQLYGAEIRIGELEDRNAHNVATLQKQLHDMTQASQQKLLEYQQQREKDMKAINDAQLQNDQQIQEYRLKMLNEQTTKEQMVQYLDEMHKAMEQMHSEIEELRGTLLRNQTEYEKYCQNANAEIARVTEEATRELNTHREQIKQREEVIQNMRTEGRRIITQKQELENQLRMHQEQAQNIKGDAQEAARLQHEYAQKERILQQEINKKTDEINKIKQDTADQIALQKQESAKEITKMRDTYNDRLSQEIATCKAEGQDIRKELREKNDLAERYKATNERLAALAQSERKKTQHAKRGERLAKEYALSEDAWQQSYDDWLLWRKSQDPNNDDTLEYDDQEEYPKDEVQTPTTTAEDTSPTTPLKKSNDVTSNMSMPKSSEKSVQPSTLHGNTKYTTVIDALLRPGITTDPTLPVMLPTKEDKGDRVLTPGSASDKTPLIQNVPPRPPTDANTQQLIISQNDGETKVQIGNQHQQCYRNLHVPRYPGIHETEMFTQQLATAAAQASIYHDNKELSWVHEIETKSYDDLEFTGGSDVQEIHRFEELDTEISSKLRQMLEKSPADDPHRKSIARKLALRERELHKQNRMIRGRQIAWLIVNSYIQKDESRTYATMTDLKNITWLGKDKVAEFIDLWTYHRNKLRGGWTEKEITDVLLEKVQHQKCMKTHMALWELLSDDQRTEEYLLKRLSHIAEENLKAINDEAYKQAMKNGQTQNFFSIVGPTLPAAPAEDTGGKKGTKGKSKGKVHGKGHGKTKTKGNNKGQNKGTFGTTIRNYTKGKGHGKTWNNTYQKGKQTKGKSKGKGYGVHNTGGYSRESSWSSRTSSHTSNPRFTRQPYGRLQQSNRTGPNYSRRQHGWESPSQGTRYTTSHSRTSSPATSQWNGSERSYYSARSYNSKGNGKQNRSNQEYYRTTKGKGRTSNGKGKGQYSNHTNGQTGSGSEHSKGSRRNKGKGYGGRKGKGKGKTYTASPATEAHDEGTTSESAMAASESEPERQPPAGDGRYNQLVQENQELRRRTQHVPYCTKYFSTYGCDGSCGLPHVEWHQHMAMKEARRAHRERSGIRIRPQAESEWSEQTEWEE